jgi:hypothetical protein
MSNKGLYKTGLVFAVLTALSWILFVIGNFGSSSTAGGIVEAYIARSESASLLMYTWGGIFGSLFVVPVFLAFFQGFRHEVGSVLAVPVAFAILGVVFLTMGFMVDTGSMIYYFGPAVAAAESADATLIVKAGQLAQDSIEVTWAIGSFLAYGGSIVWMAILLLRSERVSRWVNWVGILGGLAGFVWLVRFVPVPAPQSIGFILLFLNIIFSIVWLVGLSLVLTKSTEENPRASAEANTASR